MHAHTSFDTNKEENAMACHVRTYQSRQYRSAHISASKVSRTLNNRTASCRSRLILRLLGSADLVLLDCRTLPPSTLCLTSMSLNDTDTISMEQNNDDFRSSSNRSRKTCPYFLRGRCKYGGACQNIHDRSPPVSLFAALTGT